jgi:hypothetical protein
MKKQKIGLHLNFIVENNDKNNFNCEKFFKDTESVDDVIFYVDISIIKNVLFSKILKYVSEKNFNNTKLTIYLNNSVSENIEVFSYLIKNHKEYRNWSLTIDTQVYKYDYIDITRSLVWLSEKDALTELNLNTDISIIPSLAMDNFLLNSHHLERFHIDWGSERGISKRMHIDQFTIISKMSSNYTIQLYSSSYLDKHILKIQKRNNDLRKIVQKCSLTLIMIRKFHRTLLSPLDKNVVKIIARFLYEQRYERLEEEIDI